MPVEQWFVVCLPVKQYLLFVMVALSKPCVWKEAKTVHSHKALSKHLQAP